MSSTPCPPGTSAEMNEHQIRLAGLELESVVDGPGMRAVVFTQGCPHRCPGCHNPESHDPAAGKLWELMRVAELATQNPRFQGVTYSGGEPLEQAAALNLLTDMILERCPHFDLMLYTGYTWEDVMASGDEERIRLLTRMTIVVDGPFVLELRNLELRFRGSENQRVIDVRRTLQDGEVRLWEFPTYFGLV